MRIATTLLVIMAAFAPSAALAWSPLRAENPSVKEGNRLMAEERYSEALEAYDQAARELPDAPGVHLNRGLALLAQDLTEPSKEALAAASDPSAPPELRAAGYYNLGVAHARQGDALSEAEDFEGASAQFREAASAFKKALRTQPGNRNAAWNLEYALKRIQEQEEKQQREQQQSQDQNQDQDQDQNQDQNQDQQQDQDQSQDQQQDQEQGQDQDQQQSPESESGSDPESEPEPDPAQPDNQRARPSPAEVQRFLDALEQNEESLPLQRARRRSSGRRPPEKDW